jgi:membrane protease subunit (stomatin/prohibitin family)
MAANQNLLADRMKSGMAATFDQYGLSLDNFAVESISLPEELQKAIDTRISMGMMGDMAKFTQYQAATSIPLAAQNEGGIAGLGAGLAAGVGVGQMMSDAMRQAMTPAAAQPAAAQPAAQPAVEAPEVRLEKLKGLLDKGLITAADFDSAKSEILKKLVG